MRKFLVAAAVAVLSSSVAHAKPALTKVEHDFYYAAFAAATVTKKCGGHDVDSWFIVAAAKKLGVVTQWSDPRVTAVASEVLSDWSDHPDAFCENVPPILLKGGFVTKK